MTWTNKPIWISLCALGRRMDLLKFLALGGGLPILQGLASAGDFSASLRNMHLVCKELSRFTLSGLRISTLSLKGVDTDTYISRASLLKQSSFIKLTVHIELTGEFGLHDFIPHVVYSDKSKLGITDTGLLTIHELIICYDKCLFKESLQRSSMYVLLSASFSHKPVHMPPCPRRISERPLDCISLQGGQSLTLASWNWIVKTQSNLLVADSGYQGNRQELLGV